MGDLPNRDDYFTVGRLYIAAAPNTRINPLLVDVPGSDINLVVGSSSLMGEAISSAVAKCMRGLWVDTARLDQLDRLASDRLGLVRKPATEATIDLVLTRPTAVAGAGTVAATSRVQTADGTVFALDVDVVFGALDLTKTTTGTAAVAGPLSNVPAGAIVSFLDAPFDATIVPSNPNPAAGGADVESDAAFKGRIRGFFATIRRGVLGAIRYGATLVPGVAIATAYEIVNPGESMPGGAVELIIGDVNGNATMDMTQAVKDILLQYRAAGIPVIVSAGTVVPEPVIWSLDYETGIDTVAAQADVRAVTVAVSQFLNPGAGLYRSTLQGAARTVPGVIVRSDSLVAPAGDVFPTDNTKIIRVLPELVTFV
jgi:uncharacterized phage protein gp47/JayE